MPPASTSAASADFVEHQLPNLRQMLIHLVHDALEAKPDDILSFFADWASAQKKARAGGKNAFTSLQEGVSSRPPGSNRAPSEAEPHTGLEENESGGHLAEAAPLAVSGRASLARRGEESESGKEDGHCYENTAGSPGSRALAIADAQTHGGSDTDGALALAELKAAAHRRLRRYSALASGRRDHYMLTLEDSECDLVHLRQLEAGMLTAKRRLQEVRQETNNIVTEAETDSDKVFVLRNTYVPVWQDEVSRPLHA